MTNHEERHCKVCCTVHSLSKSESKTPMVRRITDFSSHSRVKMGTHYDGFCRRLTTFELRKRYYLGSYRSSYQVGTFLSYEDHEQVGYTYQSVHKRNFLPSWNACVYHIRSRSEIHFTILKKFASVYGNPIEF